MTKPPLDRSQRAYFDALAAARPAWLRSRRSRLKRAALVDLVLLSVAAALAFLLPDRLPLLCAGVAVLLAVSVLLLAGRDPDLQLEAAVRRTLPSEEALQRGVWSYQIDGGRVPPPGEKPVEHYWDRWK